MNKWISEFKSAGIEMKRALEIDLMLNRYEKLVQGKQAWDEKVRELIHETYEVVVASWRYFIKRTLDIVGALTGLVIGFPVLAAIAVAIRLDSRGQIFYSQIRVGYRGRLFNMYKFRTMRADAEVSTGPVWARENDPRVTRVGLFLRKTHLDELPQLLNVLNGDMSLVGPRPERPHFVNEFRKVIPQYDSRLSAKPGITGLAQIKRSYDETIADVKKKLRYDRIYIQKMCPFLDAKVIMLTIGAVVFRMGR